MWVTEVQSVPSKPCTIQELKEDIQYEIVFPVTMLTNVLKNFNDGLQDLMCIDCIYQE